MNFSIDLHSFRRRRKPATRRCKPPEFSSSIVPSRRSLSADAARSVTNSLLSVLCQAPDRASSFPARSTNQAADSIAAQFRSGAEIDRKFFVVNCGSNF